jgi:hypothetical protein
MNTINGRQHQASMVEIWMMNRPSGREEQDWMLQEFREFDRQMVHEKYAKLVEEFLGRKVLQPGKTK